MRFGVVKFKLKSHISFNTKSINMSPSHHCSTASMKRKRFYASALLVLILVGCGGRDTEPPIDASNSESSVVDLQKTKELFRRSNPEAVGQRHNIPALRLDIAKPAQAELSSRALGFAGPNDAYRVWGNVLPQAFDQQKCDSFFEPAPKNKGKEVFERLHTRKLEISGMDGVYIYVSRTVSTDDGEARFLQHVIVFGDESNTWNIRGEFRSEEEDKWSSLVFDTVMSAKITDADFPQPGSELDFVVQETEHLKFSKGWAPRCVLTTDGRFPIKTPPDCLVRILCPVKSSFVPKKKRLQLTKKLLVSQRDVEITKVSLKNKIIVDGLKGWEVVAIGKSYSNKNALYLYSCVLFDKDRYYHIQSRFGAGPSDSIYLDELKQITRSFKRKDASRTNAPIDEAMKEIDE